MSFEKYLHLELDIKQQRFNTSEIESKSSKSDLQCIQLFLLSIYQCKLSTLLNFLYFSLCCFRYLSLYPISLSIPIHSIKRLKSIYIAVHRVVSNTDKKPYQEIAYENVRHVKEDGFHWRHTNVSLTKQRRVTYCFYIIFIKGKMTGLFNFVALIL